MITKKVFVIIALTLIAALLLNCNLFFSNAAGEIDESIRMYYTEDEGEVTFFTTYVSSQYTYFWDFGDGNTSTEQNPTHLYAFSNLYNVSLTVKENETIIFNGSMTLLPTNSPPIPDFYYAPNYPFTLETVYFWDNSTDADGWIVNWSWDFNNDMVIDAYGPNVNYSYEKAGVYNIKLTVVDNQLMAKSVVQQIIVQNRVPVASFFWTRLTGSNQLIFDASTSFDSDGVIWTYKWNFGDGTNVSKQNNSQAEHIYATQGVYTVTLTVFDDSGGFSSFSRTIHSNNKLPIVNFTVSPSMPTDIDVITFTSTAYDSDGNIVNYTWRLGDGTISYNDTVEHKYADDGVYTVKLTVVDNEGAMNQTIMLLTVYNVPPVADFSWTPIYPVPNKNITFNATTSYDLDGSITEFKWNFGDGMTGNGQVINHKYTSDGTFVVSLTVKDDDDVSTTTQKTLFIADFYVDENTFDPLNNTWDTIQGAVDNASDGIFIYVLPGTYNEDVTVSKTVQIVGNNASVLGTTVAFTLSKDGIVIRNFSISSALTGVVVDADDCVVEHCIINVDKNGLSLYGNTNTIRYNYVESGNTSILIVGDDNTIQYNNYFKGSIYGCHLQGSGNIIRYNNFSGLYSTGIYGVYVSGNGNAIQDNVIYNENHGIYILNSNEIVRNTFIQCFNGIRVKHFSTIGTNYFINNTNGITASTPFMITGSNFQNNKIAVNATMITAENLAIFGGDIGIQVTNGTILRSTINGTSNGIIVLGTLIIKNCTLSHCDFGIEGDGTAELTNCTFSTNGIAINQIESTITKCKFLFNDYAVKLAKSTVSLSTFSYNDYGASLTNNVLFSQCILSYNNVAISLTGSYNTLTNNNIENNSYAITISASDNMLQNNAIKNNIYGISLLFAPLNMILENVLDNNSYNFDIEGDKLQDFYQTIPESNLINGKPMKYLINQHNLNLDGQYGYLGLVQCENLTFTNITIDHNGEGILIVFSDNITVENVTLFKNKDGIYILKSTHVYLTMVHAFQNNNGLSAKSIDYLILTGSIFNMNINGINLFSLERTLYAIDFINLSILENERGLNIENIEGVTIGQSIFVDNSKGLRSFNSQLTVTTTIFNNSIDFDILKTTITVEQSELSGTTAVNSDDSSNLTLNQNIIHDSEIGFNGKNSSLVLNGCTVNNTVQVFNLTDCDITIMQSLFSRNLRSMIEKSTAIISTSTFVNNSEALIIFDSTASLDDLEFLTNNNALILNTSTVNLVNMTFSGNTVGITVINTIAILNGGVSQNNSVALDIKGNSTLVQSTLFHHNSKAIVIHGYYNTIVNCSFWKNLHGVHVYDNNNSLFHNNFIFNVEDARDYGDNRWNSSYPTGGNYWSVYAGEDHLKGHIQNESGSDGIGDIPYEIDFMNRFDYYPLMTALGSAAPIPNEQPIAHFYYYPATLFSFTEIIFVDTSYDENGGDDIVTWLWNFGDGNTSTARNPHHAYGSQGLFNVSLTIQDRAGSSNTSKMQLIIHNLPPVADISWAPSILFSNTLVTFDAGESDDIDGMITNYTWNFGDGSEATGVSPTHRYSVSGTYTVILVVTDNSGATNETTALITISNREPNAAFTASETEPRTRKQIQFTDKSTDTDGTLIEWHWDFGDGTVSLEQNPSHMYEKKGTYTVTLNVRDNEGSEATHSMVITVKEKNVPAFDFVALFAAFAVCILFVNRLKKLK